MPWPMIDTHRHCRRQWRDAWLRRRLDPDAVLRHAGTTSSNARKAFAAGRTWPRRQHPVAPRSRRSTRQGGDVQPRTGRAGCRPIDHAKDAAVDALRRGLGAWAVRPRLRAHVQARGRWGICRRRRGSPRIHVQLPLLGPTCSASRWPLRRDERPCPSGEGAFERWPAALNAPVTAHAGVWGADDTAAASGSCTRAQVHGRRTIYVHAAT